MKKTTKQIPFGSWNSPISSTLVINSPVILGNLRCGKTDNKVYWTELLPNDSGRTVIVAHDVTSNNTNTNITPKSFDVRTHVHEYGGAPYIVSFDNKIYFSNSYDHRIYCHDYNNNNNNIPIAITPENVDVRYADFDISKDLLVFVREEHKKEGEVVNTIGCIHINENSYPEHILVSGSDFYYSPRIQGNNLAWISYNHPNMPWDHTNLYVGQLNEKNDEIIKEPRLISSNSAIVQPKWGMDGVLYYISDSSNWWNIYNEKDEESIFASNAEFAIPPWEFGCSNYDFISKDEISCIYSKDGICYLGLIHLMTKKMDVLHVPFTHITGIQTIDSQTIVFIGSSPVIPFTLVKFDLFRKEWTKIRSAFDDLSEEITSNYFSIPKSIEFPTENGLSAFAFYYAPRNIEYEGKTNEKPPLLVTCHGGPTESTSTCFNLEFQFWTSRGIAILDVNYGGSTGFGREYRNRLYGNWGIMDLDDCVNGIKYLVNKGEVDPNRVVIHGQSAGGFTSLASLVFRPTVYKAAGIYYGVSDLEALAKETHKFESNYLNNLIGPYPEQKNLYHNRSPLNFVGNIACPVIFFQGTEDKIVPVNQAEMFVSELRIKKIPVAYLLFEGEGHGFVKAESLKISLESEFLFYSKVFGYQPADTCFQSLKIENM